MCLKPFGLSLSKQIAFRQAQGELNLKFHKSESINLLVIVKTFTADYFLNLFN